MADDKDTEDQAPSRSQGKRLNAYVSVENPDTGHVETFGPGDDVPAWAKKEITNPNVWTDEAPADEPVPGPGQSQYFDIEDLDESNAENIVGAEGANPKRTGRGRR